MTESTERQSPDLSGAHPCLWMSAGLVSYKLCDRDFDCERCPLDAALRGDSREPVPATDGGRGAVPGGPPFSFPDDRRYADGHTWVRLAAPAVGATDLARVGVDAFAVALALPVHRVIPIGSGGRRAAAGAPLGELELDGGFLPVASPVTGRLHAWNPLWEDGSAAGGAALAASPYDEGWIAEIALADRRQLDALAGADAARETALLDLRRFRRRAALHLLAADAACPGPALPDGGQILTDLRSILGPRRYLELLRELLA